ncbi:hypothetical protein ABDJ41_19130 [Pedobacter sp. ASV1-7]|uniref:hypothetical protein n=1 Tax=Pedobacter sp. ASV1-7 TaxID=3145237 RepID=UPI0032E8B9BC
MNNIKIYFDEPKAFELKNVKPLSGIVGLYFIFSNSITINYPFRQSKLIYIGMSEKITNSIGVRLSGHLDGKSKNVGILNYKQVDKIWFTYLNIEMLSHIWAFRVEDLESYFLLDFVKHFGVYPICNNKTGFEIRNLILNRGIDIQWDYFN